MNKPAPPPAGEFRWQSFFQRSRDPLFLLNRQRRLLFVNRAWETLTGLAAGQVRGLACTRRAPAAPAPWDAVTRALCPPAEALQGRAIRVRRSLAAAGGRACWDIDFLPLGGEGAVLCVLGRIVPVAVDQPRAAAPPEKVVAARAASARRHELAPPSDDSSAAWRRLTEQVRLAAAGRCGVLLLGEPGTGKHWLARAIHGQGPDSERAFAALDCGRLPTAALTAALFGDGGLARRTDVGTLYLRDLERLPRDLQGRLADLLAEPGPTSPRLIAGSSADLAAAVATGRLLEELHGPLSTLVIEVPPLRRRLADLPRLVEELLRRLADALDRPVPTLTPAAWECVRAYAWPGNLRELLAALTSAAAHAGAAAIDAGDLPGPVRLAVGLGRGPGLEEPRPLPLPELLQEVERRLIRLALRRAGGNKSRAAELLSLWRPRLLRRMEALGLSDEE